MKTTRKQFKQFQDIFSYYATAFGLTSWSVNFCLQPMEGNAQAGLISNDIEDRMVTAVLNTQLESKDIHALAKHEAIEFLVNRYDEIARSRFVTAQQLTEARHELVQAIDNLIP